MAALSTWQCGSQKPLTAFSSREGPSRGFMQRRPLFGALLAVNSCALGTPKGQSCFPPPVYPLPLARPAPCNAVPRRVTDPSPGRHGDSSALLEQALCLATATSSLPQLAQALRRHAASATPQRQRSQVTQAAGTPMPPPPSPLHEPLSQMGASPPHSSGRPGGTGGPSLRGRGRGGAGRGSSVASTVGALMRNRWVGLAAASWVESCAGVAYMFSLYSQSFRDQLGYSQTQVDLVGVAKDIGGNVGIISGWLGDVAPPWVVLGVGALQNLGGYLGTWLALTGRLPGVPLWGVMALICCGTNGATFFNTGGMVTMVKNFPASRGPVVGLLKGFIGLSGALFTQLYLALYAPDRDSLLLMTAWLPSLVATLAMPLIHNLPVPPHDPRERPRLLAILACSVGTALFLLAATLADQFASVSRWASLAVALLVLAALASPALVAWEQLQEEQSQSESESQRQFQGQPGVFQDEDEEEARQGLLSEQYSASEECSARGGTRAGAGRLTKGASQERSVRRRQRSPPPPTESEEDKGVTSLGKQLSAMTSSKDAKTAGPLSPPTTSLLASGASSAEGNAAPSVPGAGADETPPPPAFPRVGEDHSLAQAARTVSFWLVYLGMTGASGSGLTAINNLGQLGRSLGYGQAGVGVAVSLMSIWNFLGRVGAGYISEHFLQKQGVPRPAFMALTQAVMALGHLVFAAALPGSLYVGSVIVGLCYGAQWGLMPAVASEIFGLKHFGTLYNWLTITNPTGSYLLSVCVAGYLYDYEAQREALSPAPASAVAPPPGAPPACHGAHCFRETFLIMALACAVAAGLSYALTVHTRQYYADEFAKRRALAVSRVDSAALEQT